jgi:hypothetical protein
MPERPTITQGVQIGVETTPGTTVPANKLLNSLDIDPELHFDISKFQPTGQKFSSIVVPGKEWAEANIKGVVSYSEIIYILNGLLIAAAPVQNGVTTAWTTTAKPAARTGDTVKTFTIEQGDANRAQRFSYGVFSEGVFNFTRNTTEFTGKMFGQAMVDAITMTATPTAIEEKPVIPNQVDVFIDSTSGGIGTTKMLRMLEAKLSITNRFGPIWVLNSALGSFASHIELDPVVTLELMMEADTQGMALLTTLRAAGTQYVRIKCTSPDLAGTAFPYSIVIDLACKISGISPYSDQAGVYALSWTNEGIYDPAWNSGQAIQIAATNKQTAL